MRHKWKYLIVGLALLTGCTDRESDEVEHLIIDAGTEYQRIHGFGTSMVNYKDFPPEYFQEDFLDMIVNDLGMSILRIPITEHLEFSNDDMDPDHFDWDSYYLSDNNHRKGMEETYRFVTELKDRGVNLFMASPWSPPQYMKTNRAPIQGGFLRADMHDEFAEYLSAYILLAKNNWDIDINWISLQNESIFIEFYRSCLYHGYGMKEALKAVMAKFEEENINTRILLNEDILFPERVAAFLEPVFDDPETAGFNGDIAVHRRAGGKDLLAWKEMMEYSGREFHMTETSGHTTNWQGALGMAVDMHEYLALGNFSSWIYWQISGNTGGSNPGLYTLMLEGKPTPKYYAAKHYYRNIRPGAIRIEAATSKDSCLVSAYKHPESGDLSIVIINPTRQSKKIMLDQAPGLPGKFTQHISSEDLNYKEIGKVRSGELMEIPGNSIMSLTGNSRNLKDKNKVLQYAESCSPGAGMPEKAGNADPFPMQSEWQGATDRHSGRYIQVEEAIQEGSLNRPREDGWTLLHESILNGDGEAVELLINSGADVNRAATDGWTPLHAASSAFVGNRGIQVKYKDFNHYEIFRMILDSGADIQARTKDGWTPLHCAVTNAYTGYRQSESTSMNRIKDLIASGAELEAKDEHGRTALHWACMQGYSHFNNEKTVVEDDVVRILLEAGADENALDAYGHKPLYYARQLGAPSIIRALQDDNQNPGLAMLSRRGNNPDTIDVDRALMQAALDGDERKLKDLLSQGANTQYRDGDGMRAIDRARDNGFESIVRILQNADNSPEHL